MTFARRCMVLSILLLGAWAARASLRAPDQAVSARALSQFPVVIDTWRGVDSPLEPDVVRTAAVDDYMNRYYRSGDVVLGLYVGYYQSQREGEALHSPMQCLPGSGWEPMKTEAIDVKIGTNDSTETINKLVVQKGIEQMMVLYWYQTRARVTASEYWRKLFLVKDAFVSGRTDVALVRIIAPIDLQDAGGEARAFSATRPFAGRVLPEVQKQLFQ